MSTVDIIVPCHNYAQFLRQCVESVLTQDGVDLRVLILDDASTDSTEQVGLSLAGEDRRVAYRRHAVNRGHIATYNEGFDWATADYTLLISADDFLVPGALRRAAGFLDDHPDVGFVYGKVIRCKCNESPSANKPVTEHYDTQIIPGAEWIARICNGDPPTTSPEVVVRTRLQKQLGHYRQDLPHWADVEMFMRFAAHAAVGYLDCDQAYYRIHEQNMHKSYCGLHDLRQRRTAFLALFDNFTSKIENGLELKDLALRHLAEIACWKAHNAFDEKDIVSCKSYLCYALETSPGISSWYVVRRLRWKMAIGPRAWGFLAFIWRMVRCRQQSGSRQ